MGIALSVLIGPAAVVLVVVVVIAVDRLREPHRDPHRARVAVDRHPFRNVARKGEMLASVGDFTRAYVGCVAICTWLTAQRHYGSARRRAWFAGQLATWSARCAEFKSLADPEVTAA